MSGKNVVLIGFMGSGKSAVGRVLAQKTNRPFFDVDSQIEKTEHKKISVIFEEEGEARFRQLEKQAVKSLASKQGAVIITGGGAVVDPENCSALQENGWLVLLKAAPETLYERLKHSTHRPLLAIQDKLSEIKRLLEERAPFYEKADVTVQTDGKTPQESAEAVLKLMQEKGI